MKRTVALAALLSLAASCHLTEQRENPALGARNTCVAEADCGASGTCIGGHCFSTIYYQDDLVFEVTPSTVGGESAGLSPGAPYYFHSVGHCESNGACLPPVTRPNTSFDVVGVDGLPHPLKLPGLVATSIQVKLLPELVASYDGCALPTVGDALRASVTLLPDDRARGLPAPTVRGGAPDAAGRIAILAQPGSYSLYVRLLAPIDLAGKPACRVPSLLLRSYRSDPLTKEYVIKLPAADHLQGTITGPPGFSFEGWRMSVVDPATGLPLSTDGTVGPVVGGKSSFGGINPDTGALGGAIEFFSPQDATTGKPGSYVLRLLPPPDATARFPAFAWTSDVLAVGGGEQVALDLSAYQPQEPVTLESARLENASNATGVSGRVHLRSTAKQGVAGAPPGRPTSFAVTVDTDPTEVGRFDVPLLPGSYDVFGVPDGDTGLGIVGGPRWWQIGATPAKQGGFVLSARERPITTVTLTALAGAPAPNVEIDAAPSALAIGAFDGVFDMDRVLPRGGSAVTSAIGGGAVVTDAGTFDLVARFPVHSFFPWTVQSGVALGPDSGSLALQAGLPIRVAGRIGEPDAELDVPVPGGSIRAYALLPATSDPPLPARYVPIGAAAIDAGGHYELLLPARVGP